MTTDNFENRIGAALAELIPAHQPDPALAEQVKAVVRERRRRRRRVATAAGGLAVLVVVGVVGGVTGRNPLMSGSDTGSAGSVMSPPPVDERIPHLLLTPSALPPSGGEVALRMANPTASGLSFGVEGKLDRWDGTSWKPYRSFAASVDFWGSAGGLHALGESYAIPAIGLGAPAHGYGPTEWLKVSGLPVGHYRLRQGEAVGLLQITTAVPDPVQLRPPSSTFLLISEVVRANTATEIHVLLAAPAAETETDVIARTGAITGPARLERLQGRTWAPAGTLSVETKSRIEFTIQAPALPAGIYRLSRHTATAGEVYGLLWVLPTLNSGT